jgi:hypothetical protein
MTMTIAKRQWLTIVLLSGLCGAASADDAPPPTDDEALADDEALPDEPAWDPEAPVTRGGPATINQSTPTPSGLRFVMEPKVGLFTKPISVDAAGPNGGKVVVVSTGRWKTTAGPEKAYAVILERLDGARWLPVTAAKRAAVGADKVRHEWPVSGRAQYRLTVMARRKGAVGPTLRVEGELRSIIYR